MCNGRASIVRDKGLQVKSTKSYKVSSPHRNISKVLSDTCTEQTHTLLSMYGVYLKYSVRFNNCRIFEICVHADMYGVTSMKKREREEITLSLTKPKNV